MEQRKWTKEDEIFLEDNFAKLKYKEIAKLLDRTEKAIKRKCNHLNLVKQVWYESRDDYFETWSSNMAYILGFFTSDGCLQHHYGRHSMEFDLDAKDDEVLKFIRDQISPDRPISYRVRKHIKRDGTNSIGASLKINNPKICQSLVKLGLCERKTGHETYPVGLPDEFKSDYLRGLFDGDGCISINKVGSPSWFICSANGQFLTDLQTNILPGIGKIQTKIVRGKNFYYWHATKKSEIFNIRDKFYSNDGFALKRKKEKMLSVPNYKWTDKTS